MEKFPSENPIFEAEEDVIEESKEESTKEMRNELRTMLFGFGDVKNPHEATLDLVNQMVAEYIISVAKIGQQLDPKKKLSLRAIHYMIQHDERKFDRVRELLRMNEELKRARKMFENPV